jgi:hypothetical protein
MFRPCGRQATPDDSRSWTSFFQVHDVFERHLRRNAPYDGIAFATGGGFAAIELADVFDPMGKLLPWARQLVAQFDCYTERAPGGRGLTLFMLDPKDGPSLERTRHPAGGSIAIARRGAVVPVTGRPFYENDGAEKQGPARLRQTSNRVPLVDRSEQLRVLVREISSGFPRATGGATASETSGAPKQGNTALANEEQEPAPHKTPSQFETQNTSSAEVLTCPGQTQNSTPQTLNPEPRTLNHATADQTRRADASTAGASRATGGASASATSGAPKPGNTALPIEEQEQKDQAASGPANAKPQALPPIIPSSHHPLIVAQQAPEAAGAGRGYIPFAAAAALQTLNPEPRTLNHATADQTRRADASTAGASRATGGASALPIEEQEQKDQAASGPANAKPHALARPEPVERGGATASATSGAPKPGNTASETSGAPKPGNTALPIEEQEQKDEAASGPANTKPQALPPIIPSPHHPLIVAQQAPEAAGAGRGYIPFAAAAAPQTLNPEPRTLNHATADQTRRADASTLGSGQAAGAGRNHIAATKPATANSETRNTQHQTQSTIYKANPQNASEAAQESIADQLVELAMTEFRLGRTPADETFAVALDGPNIAHMLRGGSAPLRKALARAYRRRCGRTVSCSTLSDALNVIEAEAGDLEPEGVALRVASLPSGVALAIATASATSGAPKQGNTALKIEEQEPKQQNALAQETAEPQALPPIIPSSHHPLTSAAASQTLNPEPGTLNSQGIAIDLGRPDGKTVIVTAAGWRIVDRSPVLFRRTSLSDQLPLPEPGGDLRQLRRLVNVTDEGYEMLRGWLVAGLFPSVAHSVLVLRGERGTGKTTALRMLANLVDPSASLPFGTPTDTDNWVLIANGGWCLQLDNIAGITPWLSQELCRAVTGAGSARRRLYTDADLSVITFRRVVAMTCIHLGAVAEDLADRLLPVDLEFIDREARLSETDLLDRYEQQKPQLLGALLDEVAAVLRNLPHVHLAELPRMADFARILSALPVAPNTPPAKTPLAIYLRLIDRLHAELVEGDPVVTAVAELMKSRQEWQGTATELLAALTKAAATSRSLPKTPNAMRMSLDRLAPALKSMGIQVEYGRAANYLRTRLIILTANAAGHEPAAGSESE